MWSTPLVEQIDHVLERFHVAALITRHGNALGILLDGGIDQFLNRAVVSQVNYLDSAVLQDSAHNVGRCVMAVK